jgi:hypothetical protein
MGLDAFFYDGIVLNPHVLFEKQLEAFSGYQSVLHTG